MAALIQWAKARLIDGPHCLGAEGPCSTADLADGGPGGKSHWCADVRGRLRVFLLSASLPFAIVTRLVAREERAKQSAHTELFASSTLL